MKKLVLQFMEYFFIKGDYKYLLVKKRNIMIKLELLAKLMKFLGFIMRAGFKLCISFVAFDNKYCYKYLGLLY